MNASGDRGMDPSVKSSLEEISTSVYLIAIADAAKRDPPVQKAGLDSWGCSRGKGEWKQEGKQSKCSYPRSGGRVRLTCSDTSTSGFQGGR